MSDCDLGDVAVSLGLEGVHSTGVWVTLRPDEAVRLMVDHVEGDVVVVAEEEMLVTNEALTESVGLLPRAFKREVPEVVDLVAGAHHGVVAVSDCRVHLFHVCERTPLAEGQDFLVVDVVIRCEENVWLAKIVHSSRKY